MIKYNHCVFLGAGHGPVKDGKYTTAPSKMFKHPEGWFYEGVKNRKYVYEIKRKLELKGVNVVLTSSYTDDNKLYSRSFLANTYHSNVQRGFYISEHSNATSEHNARGFLTYTSKGKTRSDLFASMAIDMYKEYFPNLKVLTNYSRDGDADFEADFHVLAKTNMPSVLLENLFFDNHEDYLLLESDEYFEKYTTFAADWAEKCIQWLDAHG